MNAKASADGRQGVADRAIASAMDAISQDEIDATPGSFLELTSQEQQELDLLCYVLGVGKNACVSFATKYLCSMIVHSTLPVKLPRAQKPSKSNPACKIKYGLNMEVLASLKLARAKLPELRLLTESEVVKLAVLLLCKKLLPVKGRRVLTIMNS
jgi:hypothetical protein